MRAIGFGGSPGGFWPHFHILTDRKGCTVARSELGTKRICPETGKKFYDLDKDPIVSPYTGKSYPRSFFDAETPVLTELVREQRMARDEEDEAEDDEMAEDDTEIVALEEADEDEAPARKESASSPDVDGPGDDDTDDDIDLEDDDDDDDDTFLADDEDESEDDVTGYIGGSGGRDDED